MRIHACALCYYALCGMINFHHLAKCPLLDESLSKKPEWPNFAQDYRERAVNSLGNPKGNPKPKPTPPKKVNKLKLLIGRLPPPCPNPARR